ncbi:grasp-with-spasm system ATP-grasp peptide maturase [Chryseobacterium gregarium]|uniref:grasp-with-spasm system ATP-grasp peptide maturase n=1 Tax=Chryseobacterium gregarium TaxID=456299 RepID=UPI0003FEEDDC|nr:grasp-with-spasm system ATP-grasp peptide maturase [Chryseobacterium gregarium]
MVLILSNKNDFTTNLVQDWLYHYGKEVTRINSYITDLSFRTNNIFIKSETDEHIDLNDVKSFWYRKGSIIKPMITNHQTIKSEFEITEGYISYLLREKKGIGHYQQAMNLNKLIVLQTAKKNGLNIPETYVLDNKEDLSNLISENKNREFITKMKTESSMFQFQDTASIIYTNVLNEKFIKSFPERFAPSLIQEKIEKLMEIRTFFLNGKTWSMAIFSQNDDQTKDDYRRYNNKKPNRHTLFKLPKNLEDKLCLVMNDLNLDTGSIDWILTRGNQYYFLEVNPTGQFSNMSMTCNYPLEKLIAEKL